MMTNRRAASVALLVAVATGAAGTAVQAQTHRIQPGLWEHQVTIRTGDPMMDQMAANAQARMAELPPEQRQMVEQMMANRGMRMGSKPNTVQVCVTPEQAARDQLPQESEHCTQLKTQRSGNTLKVQFKCETQPPTSGEGEFTLVSPTRYTGRTRVDTVVAGQPQRVEMTMVGVWQSADCKGVAPAKR